MAEDKPTVIHSRRTAVGILVAAILVVVAAGIWWFVQRPPVPTNAPPAQVSIATFSKALGNAPFHIARHFGWFEQHADLRGIRINYAEFNDRPAISGAFARGDLDLLFSAEIPSILIRAQGEETRIVLTSTYAAQEVLVPTASPISSVSDLRGRRVSVQSGTSSHFGLFHILDAAGLRPDDVRILYMPAAEGQAAFETGQIDAWAAWAPWVETQQVANRGRAIQGGNAVIYSVGTMRLGFMDAHPAQARALFDVIQRAKRWMVEHPAEAQQIVASELGFELPVVQRAWPKFHWDAQLSETQVTDFQEKTDFLVEQRLSREGVRLDVRRQLVDFRFQPQAPD